MKYLIAALVSCLFFISCNAQDARHSFMESYYLPTPGKITISCSDGNIEVVPSDEKEVQVFYIVKKRGRVIDISREELEKELTLSVSHEGNNLDINVENDYWKFWSPDQIDVHFKLYVPREMTSSLHTSDGDITVSGLQGDQQCKTSDGDIFISDIKGNVGGKTSDGNITISGIQGRAYAKTSDGDIEVEQIVGNLEISTSDGNVHMSDIAGDISAKTSDGNISFRDIRGSLTAKTSDGNVRGSVMELTKQLTVNASDGTIDIAVAGNPGLDVEIEAESLDVPLQNFSGHADREVIRGKMNGGGIPVSLRTDGKVRLSFE